MKELITGNVDLDKELRPETALERQLLGIPAFRRGLFWGVPRYGHPEGEVYKHIKEVLANIDRLCVSGRQREQLRLIAFVHDSFKYCEDKRRPRDWSKHHAVLARQFLEQYPSDPEVLSIVEWHDEAYYCWRTTHLYRKPEAGELRLQRLLRQIEGHRQLYYLFFKCDTLTGDKNKAPLRWFEAEIPDIERVDF